MTEASAGRQLSGSPDRLAYRVCTDSRHLQEGDLFVALRGEHFDGHEFVPEAARKGVAGVMVERAKTPAPLPDCPVIAVDDTRTALGRVAARYRSDLGLCLIAVAGSNGKTSTKDLLAGVLAGKFKTWSSKASFNNEIGVPTTLLELGKDHEVAVLEFGTNHPGELAPLLQMARPRFGVLTSIGREHLEFFGDLQGVIREEGCIGEFLPRDGILFLNGDADGADLIAQRTSARVVRVGLGGGNHWRAGAIGLSESGITFDVRAPRAEYCRTFTVPLYGRHHATNALLTMAVAAELGLNPAEVQHGFNRSLPSKMRLQLWRSGGVTVLDDSYNANADSMRAALESLRDFPAKGRRIAVLGDMGELGDHAAEAHREVGELAGSTRVDLLIAVGRMATLTAGAARERGCATVQVFEDAAEAAAALRATVRPGDVVLLKGSRAARIERVGDALRAGPPNRESDPGQGGPQRNRP